MTFNRRGFLGAAAVGPALLLAGVSRPALAQEERMPFFNGLPANVFISPAGKPFRAAPGEAYPVARWFAEADANKDGKLDKAEFIADSLAFFQFLDRNGDGVLNPQEVAWYESHICPEVIGMRVEGTGWTAYEAPARLWKTQGIPGGLGPGGGIFRPGGATGPGTSVDPGQVDPGPEDESGHAAPYDASGKGASPYSLFDEPEPVSAADIHFRGLISKFDFQQLALAHFQTLDADGQGFLTLAGLPKTPVQRRLERLSQQAPRGRGRRGGPAGPKPI